MCNCCLLIPKLGRVKLSILYYRLTGPVQPAGKAEEVEEPDVIITLEKSAEAQRQEVINEVVSKYSIITIKRGSLNCQKYSLGVLALFRHALTLFAL